MCRRNRPTNARAKCRTVFFIPAKGYLTYRVVTKGIKADCIDSLRREYRLRRFTIPRCRAWYLHRAEIRELLNFKFSDFFR